MSDGLRPRGLTSSALLLIARPGDANRCRHPHALETSNGGLPGEIPLQMLDHVRLLRNRGPHEVADRDEADDLLLLRLYTF